MSLTVLALGVGIISWMLVALVRRHALRTNLLDLPSERGSHQQPRPRGGGLGAIAAILAGVLGVTASHALLDIPLALALGGVALAAVVGWLDDRASLPVLPRLMAHVAVGAAVAWFARGVAGPLGGTGAVALAWWALWTVAAINVTNFMDGIDGLIGSQMVVWGGYLVAATGGHGLGAVIGACLFGAAGGFLAWNWAPAKIFLGDAGSGALGVVAVIGGVAAMRQTGQPVELVFLPLLPLFLDASATLVKRAVRGQRLWEAHREHLYQRLANSDWGHARTAAVYAIAAAAGVVVSQAGTSYRALIGVLYALAVLGVGAWLDSRVKRRTMEGGHNRPSP